MSEIKREYSYRTTDGKLHSGKNAATKAKDHQKRVDFRKVRNIIVAEAEKIFNLEDMHTIDDGETDEDILLDKINEHLYCDVNDLEDLVIRFVNLQMNIPEFASFLVLIENRFEKFK